MYRFLLLTLIFFFVQRLHAQNRDLVISGPMLGYSEPNSVLIWYELGQDARTATLLYWEKGDMEYYYELDCDASLGKLYNPVKFVLPELKNNTTYFYQLNVNGKVHDADRSRQFTTRSSVANPDAGPADITFLAGSCTYINDPAVDPPGRPYGQDTYIFKTMTALPSDFMLWLGDNVYLRPADYNSASGMQYRYSFNRKSPVLAGLLASRPNYAVWDDHDYGSNDAGASFDLKPVAQKLFRDYWGNKTYGLDGDNGIYSRFSWGDCDFFLMDDRSWRSAAALEDSVDGKPNCEKKFFGPGQFSWLKDQLLTSTATFKFIVSGSQMLNPLAEKEHFRDYPCEFNTLMAFIVKHKIPGIVFLSGDRHFSEVIAWKPEGGYTLYDFTCSALTSTPHPLSPKEMDNPFRVSETLVEENNFSLFEIRGGKGERTLKVQTMDKKGVVKARFEINASDLK